MKTSFKKQLHKWIEDRDNEGKPVQLAITASNACFWPYLTTSGQVCREEYFFEEDRIDWTETFDLPKMTWSSCKRFQKCLINFQQG